MFRDDTIEAASALLQSIKGQSDAPAFDAFAAPAAVSPTAGGYARS